MRAETHQALIMKRKIAVLNINNDAFSTLTAMNYNERQVLAQRFQAA